MGGSRQRQKKQKEFLSRTSKLPSGLKDLCEGSDLLCMQISHLPHFKRKRKRGLKKKKHPCTKWPRLYSEELWPQSRKGLSRCNQEPFRSHDLGNYERFQLFSFQGHAQLRKTGLPEQDSQGWKIQGLAAQAAKSRPPKLRMRHTHLAAYPGSDKQFLLGNLKAFIQTIGMHCLIMGHLE